MTTADHIHFFFRKNAAGKLARGFCNRCAGRACNGCRGSGRQPTEWGCFAPKRWGRCRHCKGSGLGPTFAESVWQQWWNRRTVEARP